MHMSLKENYPEIEALTPEGILEWTWNSFGEDAVFTSSFGAEDMVVIDMMAKKDVRIPIATIDTGRLPEETYELMDRVASNYGVAIRSYFPEFGKVEEMVRDRGMNLFYKSVENRKLCCGIRKVEPLNRLLKGKKAWVTGLRADQTSFRQDAEVLELDSRRNLVKVNPILKLTSDEVWNYIRKNNIPYNSLHDQGYPSIGCAPCTRAVKPGEGERAGRWWWETDVKECGLHVKDSSSWGAAPEFRANNHESGSNGGGN